MLSPGGVVGRVVLLTASGAADVMVVDQRVAELPEGKERRVCIAAVVAVRRRRGGRGGGGRGGGRGAG